ncbi:MAG TPA: mevalonate kinase, partial [Myxococcaceae bacterium]|nr:mevalonate kinase [Myxococcaceae bacterium]
ARKDGSWVGFGPGKVILLGEHAVVYGYPALAGALSLGVTARGEWAARPKLVVPASLNRTARAALERAFARAARSSHAPPLRLTLESTLPVAVGLGSSAAVAVACAKVLLQAAGDRAQGKPLLRVAREMEAEFHGTPSGVDHCCSALGTLVRFQRRTGAGEGRARAVPSRKPVKVLVAVAGLRTPTRTTVAALRERQARWPERYARVFKEIGKLADEGARAVEEGDLEGLGDAMNLNHGLLSALGLSSSALDECVYSLRREGALGAKLTGAGGDGGAVIGLFREPEPAVARLRRQGWTCFSSQLGGPLAL